jgi:hypothetical protein
MELAIIWVLMLGLVPIQGLIWIAHRKETIQQRNLIKSVIRIQKQGRL